MSHPNNRSHAKNLLASIIILFVTPIFCFRAESQAKRVTPEEYAIYSAILNAADNYTILNRKREFPEKGKWGGRFVIQTTTSGSISDYHIKQAAASDAKFLSRSVKPMFDSLMTKNKDTYALGRYFNLTSNYELLSASGFASYFKTNTPFVAYEAFHKRYGQRSAYHILSRVGFNSQRTKALVYVFTACHTICAFARFIELNKVRGKWKVVVEYG